MKLELQKFGHLKRQRSAFTMVEILVVIAIIGILSGMLLTALPAIIKKANIRKVQAVFTQVDTAIQDYQKTYGSYPLDNPTNTLINPLYYELQGATWNNASNSYDMVGERILDTHVRAYFGQDGLRNVTHDPNDASAPKAKPFLIGLTDKAYINITNGLAIDLKVLRVPVTDNDTNLVTAANGDLVNVWHYRSGNNAVFNKGKYDFWGEFVTGGTRYRVSNWESKPVQIEDTAR